MIFTIPEVIYFIILTAVIGYIFTGYIRKPTSEVYHPFSFRKYTFKMQDFLFSVLIIAPAIVLHELAHKFIAIFFGLTANFFILWEGLGLAVLLKLLHSPFLIIAPGYVLISHGATPLQDILISFAGPLTNLILFLISGYILNHSTKLTRTQAIGFYLTKQINLFLLIFNMLPIPPLDGYHVFSGLLGFIF